MKTQIRRGVFETNSSSTHSLQLNKQTLDEALKEVNQRILDNYSFQEREFFDESEFLNNNGCIPNSIDAHKAAILRPKYEPAIIPIVSLCLFLK